MLNRQLATHWWPLVTCRELGCGGKPRSRARCLSVWNIRVHLCRCGEMADAQDLKSWGPLKGRVGSSPTTGTIPNCECSNVLGQGKGETDTKTDTSFTAPAKLG